MKKKLLLSLVLLSGIFATSCGGNSSTDSGNKEPETNKPTVKTEILTEKLTFDYPDDSQHMKLDNYCDTEEHKALFKNDFFASSQYIDLNSLFFTGVYGPANKYPTKAVKGIKFGSKSGTGAISFNFNEENFKAVKGVEVEVCNYLLGNFNQETHTLTYTNEPSSVKFNNSITKEIPATSATKFEELTPFTITLTEEECKDFTNEFTIENVSSNESAGRFFLKSISYNLEYIVK